MSQATELQIAMLGASGVGKTTLLTSMYEQFEATTREVNIQLKPANPYTEQTLQKYLKQLRSLAETFEAKEGLRGTAATAGPNSIKPFNFTIGKKADKPSLQLCFRDYPGGYISSQDITEKRYVRKLLEQSAAVVVAIDTPAIMEVKGKWHQLRNKPNDITELFKIAYRNLNEPKLVILAPVKCETYVQDEESAHLLCQRIEQEYARLLEFFQAPGLADKVAVVITPVQTVGCVIFLVAGERNGQPVFTFTKTGFDATYSPQDSEQMLRYLLRFLFKLYLEQRRWPILNQIRQVFNPDGEFKQAVEQFTKGCKTNGGFTILQGKKWLHI